ncbi:phage major capsid protein, P2 family [Chromobacterium sphagni]|uniref:Phage major capsid protein, P2 family n=1 Tax=Chromobacterium sphagni TaxID=1903179 RepID=A0A1S1WSZ3_9NEIS|nr:phage major capsid protein, P2 family [Chromobacterium sphagni]OHX10298.1 phage major capsid protein, P2 family [Chromobacterium sphagni]
MKNATRNAFDQLLDQIAKLNHVSADAVTKTFAVNPSVQQKLENRIQETSEFLTRINIIGVDEQEGEKLGLGLMGTVAGRTKVTPTNPRRPRNLTDLNSQRYRCEQTEFDTAIPYAQIDMWAKFPDFQTRIRDLIVKQQGLDRMMIGFNGVAAAPQTDRDKFPLLQDVNKGWLQQYRDNAKARVMASGDKKDGKVLVGHGGDYANLDALVMDAVASLIDPTLQGHPDLVVILGRDLLHDKYFPIVNQDQKPTEQLAADIVISQKRIGNLPAVTVPFFPASTMLITTLANLSIYFQNGSRRRHLREEPDFNQVANYESSNDAYVVERYEAGCVIENIEQLPPPPPQAKDEADK